MAGIGLIQKILHGRQGQERGSQADKVPGMATIQADALAEAFTVQNSLQSLAQVTGQAVVLGDEAYG